MEITKREILASISIIAILLIIGVLISEKISEIQMDKNEKYNKALKITDVELFRYGMNTNVGNAFIYGELEAVDSVSYPEIEEKYLHIEKVKEEYTQHTRVVTYTDSNGKTSTTTETYWTWDKVGSEELKSKEVTFLGIKFNTSQFDIPNSEYIKTIKESSEIRYKYYGYPSKTTVTIFTYLANGNIEKERIPVYKNKTIEETINILESNVGLIVFWVVWILFSGGIVYGFYYLDNKWLNIDK
ncbi:MULTISPECIES: hypothetical protein [unclassified Clostridium]|uniref:hypothetical protein n=1 Tax=unclassified Clostridium TaxID=2614128 RepID=UPI0025BAEBF8|nr:MULTISPECIES: hypothetical protein [unclassified Clostridium]